MNVRSVHTNKNGKQYYVFFWGEISDSLALFCEEDSFGIPKHMQITLNYGGVFVPRVGYSRVTILDNARSLVFFLDHIAK